MATAAQEQKKLQALAAKEADRIGALKIASISTPEQYQRAGELRREVKLAEKNIEEAKRKIVDPLNEALKQVRSFFRPFEEKCSRTLALIDTELRAYTRREEEKRRAEEQRLRELAEKENERLRKEAERQAAKAEKKGDDLKAAEIRNAVPLVATPVIARSEKPKLAGTKERAHWKARVPNPGRQRQLLQLAIDYYNQTTAVHGEKIMGAQFWSIDETALGAHARTTKGEIPVPGVEFYDEPIYATETAR